MATEGKVLLNQISDDSECYASIVTFEDKSNVAGQRVIDDEVNKLSGRGNPSSFLMIHSIKLQQYVSI